MGRGGDKEKEELFGVAESQYESGCRDVAQNSLIKGFDQSAESFSYI
jgi:hypothetical protein